MGNNISGATTRAADALDSYVTNLKADIVYEKTLGPGRFLKTVKGRHTNGPVVIKIFIKPDPGLSLRPFRRRLKIEREALEGIPNVYSHQTFFETDQAGFIIRQWVSSSLYDRISTRPFLSNIEKKWITFQILTGMQNAIERKVTHGDIKSENILVTSWNWVYITDFGSVKPVFLPEDDPTDYSFYFDTSGRRTCYVAPERFYSEGSEISTKRKQAEAASEEDVNHHRQGKIKESMDVFSAGCVIAEMFLEGKVTFTLSQLFKYRSGELNMTSHLQEIDDDGIRALVTSMIALDSKSRPTFRDALAAARGTTFPESFYNFLHQYIASVNQISVPPNSQDSAFHAPPKPSQQSGIPTDAEPKISTDPKALPNDSDTRIDRIWTEFDELEPYLLEDEVEATVTEMKVNTIAGTSGKPFQDIIPVELSILNRPSKLRGALASGQKAAAEDGPALIILSLVTANIRNATLPSSKLRSLDLLLALACHLTDEAKLDRLVPYAIDLLHDDSPAVRVAAIRTLVQVLILVSAITPANASIFPEYILPNIRHLSRDPDVSVRCIYAQCIAPLADTSAKYLEMGQALRAHGMFKLTDEYDDINDVSYDASLKELHALIQDQLVTLLFDPSSVVKRAALINISSLCVFFGRQITNEVLLSHMITYLNDRDWQLRWAFFDAIVTVAAFLGPKTLEEYIFPLMIQALSGEFHTLQGYSHVEEFVVAKVLAALTSLSDLSLFSKMRMWELMSVTVGFLYHPNIWIREGAAAFLASAAKKLPATDVWCILYPGLRQHLRSDIRAISESSLLTTVKSPLPRSIFDAAVAWAMKGEKSQYWHGAASNGAKSSKPDTSKDAVVGMKKSGTMTLSRYGLSDDDAIQVAKLRQLGLSGTDESKLIALREYTLKLAMTTLSFQQREKIVAPHSILTEGKDVELGKLNVMPHTVFLGSTDSRSSRPDRLRTPILGTPRISRLNSLDHTTREGTAVEDLRRRLNQMDGSTVSLTSASVSSGARAPGTRRTSMTSVSSALPSPLPSHMPPSPFDGTPASPSESVMSTGIDVLRRKHQRTATAVVGSVNANIAGVLETPKVRTAEEEALTSGRTSPVSVAGTIRGHHRGQETGINNVLEAIYQENFRDPTSDFGPRVHTGPPRRRSTIRSSYPPRDPTRRPEVTLLAHLNAHSGAINGIVVAPDHAFFVSCSDDKTVKVWDSARLERNVTSKPRQVYSQHHAPVMCICMLEASHCFASAATDGSLHVVRVHLNQQTSSTPKYKQLQVVREHRVDRVGEYITCMTHYNTEATSNLVYATSQANIVILDLRSMRILHSMEDLRHHGPITCMCVDRKRAWLLTGTAFGILTLWDIRFGLRLKSWAVNAAASASPGQSVRIHQCLVHPTKGKGRWIVVAVEPQTASDLPSSFTPGVALIEVWDIEKGVMVEMFATQEQRTYETSSNPASPGESLRLAPEPSNPPVPKEAPKSPAEAIAALVKARAASQASPGQQTPVDDVSPHLEEADLEAEERRRATQVGIRAMVVGSDFGGLAGSGTRMSRLETTTISENGVEPFGGSRNGGFLLTGSEDRKIRLWDLSRVDRSIVVSGLEMESDKPSFRYELLCFLLGSHLIDSHRTTQADLSSEDSGTPSAIHTESHIRHATKSHQPSWRTSLIGQHQQQLLKGHQDCITALACLDVPFRCCIISGDRLGVVKVFRVELD
ncbi:Serine/threonine-protein kinase [Tulasnella sp. 424]|nr:Serine/threonine-protein kinase [Tulasnella sp. 424]